MTFSYCQIYYREKALPRFPPQWKLFKSLFCFSTLIPTTVCHCFLHSPYLLICSSFHNTYKFISIRDSSYVFSVWICIGIPIFSHFYTHAHAQTTHPLLIPFCLLCFTCADLSRALSLPPPSSSVSHSCAFVRSPSLSHSHCLAELLKVRQASVQIQTGWAILISGGRKSEECERVRVCEEASRVSAQAFVLQHLRSPGADSAWKKKRNLFHT